MKGVSHLLYYQSPGGMWQRVCVSNIVARVENMLVLCVIGAVSTPDRVCLLHRMGSLLELA